jgi:hypothetical protein
MEMVDAIVILRFDGDNIKVKLGKINRQISSVSPKKSDGHHDLNLGAVAQANSDVWANNMESHGTTATDYCKSKHECWMLETLMPL